MGHPSYSTKGQKSISVILKTKQKLFFFIHPCIFHLSNFFNLYVFKPRLPDLSSTWFEAIVYRWDFIFNRERSHSHVSTPWFMRVKWERDRKSMPPVERMRWRNEACTQNFSSPDVVLLFVDMERRGSRLSRIGIAR